MSAITRLDSVLETISKTQAKMGALQNRLTASMRNLSNQSLMTEVAIGHLMNADFSVEMAKLTKAMILSEAANYVLSGAQISKSNLIKLL